MIHGLIGISTFILFCKVMCSDPGYINEKVNMKSALQILQPSCICSDCEIVKPRRSKHCEICQKCVSVYDHHCPWINNCVGSRNFKYFYSFIAMLLINIIFGIVTITLVSISHEFHARFITYILLGYSFTIQVLFLFPLA